MTTTWSTEADQRLRRYLHRDGYQIPKGLGTREAACSIAAINLALTGKLSDDIPECMSEVIGTWILDIQDGIPDVLRNSPEWKELLPLAAGTGREQEQERAEIIMDWLWGTVLPYVQPTADKGGFGGEWQAMCNDRTAEAAREAEEAAWAAGAAGEAVVAAAAWAARAAAEAEAWAAWVASAKAKGAWAAGAGAAREKAYWAAWAAREAVQMAGKAAARTAEEAAETAEEAAEGSALAEAWAVFDPPALLRRLVHLEGDTP